MLATLIVTCVLIGTAAFIGMAGRTALALLVSPIIYSLLLNLPRCSLEPTFSWGSCAVIFSYSLLAPVAVLIGPIAHEAEDPPNPYPEILLIALAIVVAWTAIAFLIKRYRGASK
ncbi:MAG: hypothetical protein Q8N31_23210 [Reyranella sp.]|nr:hypothetical protein [Reyranella sp.]MDP3162932.1 hypothetical protein [Reyranella sp.]